MAYMGINPNESPRARFAYELRKFRHDQGISQRQLGRRITYTAALISMIEQGKRRPTQELADKLDAAFNLDGTFAKLYLGTTWAGAPEHFRGWLDEEGSATALRSWEPMLVDGLLQTEEYARAVLQAEPWITAQEIDARVESRMRRKSILLKNNPPQVLSIFDEGVLHRPVGSATIMRAQLEHLLEVAECPQVTVQLVPYSAQALSGLLGGFTIAERNGMPTSVYLQAQPRGRIDDDRALISDLVRRYDAIRAEAYPQHLTLDMIKDIRDKWI